VSGNPEIFPAGTLQLEMLLAQQGPVMAAAVGTEEGAVSAAVCSSGSV